MSNSSVSRGTDVISLSLLAYVYNSAIFFYRNVFLAADWMDINHILKCLVI